MFIKGYTVMMVGGMGVGGYILKDGKAVIDYYLHRLAY